VPEVAVVHIWDKQETVLVHFVRVVRDHSDTSSESVLSDDVSLNETHLRLSFSW
jgi:hypothetical protein